MFRIYLILFITLFLLAADSMAQETQNYGFGLVFRPEFLTPDDKMPLGQFTGYGDIEADHFNYAVGMQGYFEATNRIDILMGMLYANRDLTGTEYCTICDYFTAPQPEKLNMRYLEFPIEFHYRVINSAVKVKAIAGFGLNFALDTPDRIFPGDSAFNTFYLSGRIGAGIFIPVSSTLELGLTAAYDVALTDIIADSEYGLSSVHAAVTFFYPMNY